VGPPSSGIGRLAPTCDESGLVANAGLLLVVTVVRRLNLEAVIDAMMRIPSKLGGFASGRKELAFVHATVAGATHIHRADVLRRAWSALSAWSVLTLANRADTIKVLPARLRKKSVNAQRGANRFVEELVIGLRRAGATGTLVIRFDSGCWSKDILSALERLSVSFTMAVRPST